MFDSGGDSGYKKLSTVNRRMFIMTAAKLVIFGGIITNTKDDYSGSWKCLLSNKMESNPNNDEWVLFNDLL